MLYIVGTFATIYSKDFSNTSSATPSANPPSTNPPGTSPPSNFPALIFSLHYHIPVGCLLD
jgi:hypothetical protein